MTQFKMNRRAALASAVAMPFVASNAATVSAQSASTGNVPKQGPQTTDFRRVMLGEFEVTTLLAGTMTRDEPQSIFGMNVDADTFNAASDAANIPNDAAQFFFTPTLVNTGTNLVLFDTGLNGAATTASLEAAGYTADQVDTVVLTHMHGDHINGLSTDGDLTYQNASYVAGAVEFDTAGGDAFEGKVRPLAEQTSMIAPGDSVVSGIEGYDLFGHTPGHMGFLLDSGGQQLLIAADFANHYVWSLAHPDWEVLFDRDKEAAAATRRRVLSMLAAEKMPFIGYHMPFPAVGYVETRGDGFHYTPMSYQLML